MVACVGVAGAGGCVGSPSTELTSAEKDAFKGKPPSGEQRQAMQNSIDEYRRTHTSFPPKPGEEGGSGAPNAPVSSPQGR